MPRDHEQCCPGSRRRPARCGLEQFGGNSAHSTAHVDAFLVSSGPRGLSAVLGAAKQHAAVCGNGAAHHTMRSLAPPVAGEHRPPPSNYPTPKPPHCRNGGLPPRCSRPSRNENSATSVPRTSRTGSYLEVDGRRVPGVSDDRETIDCSTIFMLYDICVPAASTTPTRWNRRGGAAPP